MNSDVTILVLSCDKYCDLWKPFFSQFHKHWKDCPYPVVLGSNTISYKKETSILSGPDKDWSSSLLRLLEQIKTQYVFLWLDDIFPISDVDAAYFTEALAFLRRKKGIHMHAYPIPTPDRVDGGFGVFDKGAPYRATALGFWRVEYLKTLLLPGESPWNFEIMGSYRISYDDGFYSVAHPFFERIHVVEKGKIFNNAFEYCRAHGIHLDTGKRHVLSGGGNIRSVLQSLYFNAVLRIPWRTRLKIMNLLRKLLVSY